MCMLTVNDYNKLDDVKNIDIGNYYVDEKDNKCVVITKELASKYHNLIDCDIYITRI